MEDDKCPMCTGPTFRFTKTEYLNVLGVKDKVFVDVPTWRCEVCDFEFTNFLAEEIRYEAVKVATQRTIETKQPEKP